MLAMVRGELKGVPTDAVEPFMKLSTLVPAPKNSSVPPGAWTPQTESIRVGLGSFERTVQLNSAEPPSFIVALLGRGPNL